MADDVLDAASQHGPVSFLTYGSPTVSVTPSFLLVSDAPQRGLRVAVCQAPSFIETVCATVGVDPCEGLVVWEASSFVRRDVRAPMGATLLITQAAIVGLGDGGVRGRHSLIGDLASLRDALLKSFPPSHQVQFVRTAALGHPATIKSVPLDELSGSDPPEGCTLVVRPLP